MFAIKRSGFAMILAILVVVLIALGGVLLLSNASKGAKSVGDNYVRAQAELLAESATEFGVMRAQGFDHGGGNCLNNMTITVYNSDGQAAGNEMFDITVTYAYSFRNPAGAFNNACNLLTDNTGKDTMMLMDVTVVDHNLTTEGVRVHKRTWQKL